MNINIPDSFHPVQGPPISETKKEEIVVPRGQIPAAEHHQEPVLQKIDLHVQEVKAEQPLVLTSKQMDDLRNAVNNRDHQFLRDNLSPKVISAYNRQAQDTTLLNFSISIQNKEAVEIILSHKTDLDAVDRQGYSAVMDATMRADPEILTLVLDAGCSPNIANARGETPLHEAIHNKDIIDLLLKYKADPKVVSNDGFTPAMLAESVGKSDHAALLREAAQDFERFWENTIMLAHRFGLDDKAQTGTREIELEGFYPSYTWNELDHSIQDWMQDPSFSGAMPRNQDGMPALTNDDMQEILEAIRKGNSDFPIDLTAIQKGNLTAIQSGGTSHSTGIVTAGNLLFKCNRGLGNKNQPGIGIYEILDASLVPFSDFAKHDGSFAKSAFNKAEYFRPPYMRQIGYLPHKDQHSGNCTWASAKLVFRAALYAKLLKKGCPPHTAYHVSLSLYKTWTSFDRFQAVNSYMNDPYLKKSKEELQKQGINPEKLLQSVYRRTINTRFAPLMNFLLETCKMDLSYLSKRGETVLHIAVKTGNTKQIKDLLAKGLDVNQGDSMGTTPFHIACWNGNPAVIKLLAANADINKPDNNGMTPLHIACQRGDERLVNFLLQKGADATASDKAKKSALHYASSNPYPPLIAALIQAGTPFDLPDVNGVTPLHLASYNGHFDFVKFLLEQGANPNRPDNNNMTPLAFAHRWNWPELVELFSDKAGNLDESIAATPVDHNSDVKSEDNYPEDDLTI